MTRPAPRLHRLPHRTDYILVPAPLDLSLPLATEKSALPAIIVTPCSPSSARDFSIAFLASPPKPSLKQRFESYKYFNSSPCFRLRSLIVAFCILLIPVLHLLTHRMAVHRSRLELSVQSGEAQPVNWFVDLRTVFGAGESMQIQEGQQEFNVLDAPQTDDIPAVDDIPAAEDSPTADGIPSLSLD